MPKVLLLLLLLSYIFGDSEIFGQRDTLVQCSTCQEIDLVEFEQAQLQMSLNVNNPKQPKIDSNIAALRFKPYKGYRNWFPMAAEKQTLCGIVAFHNIHKLGRENDYNFRIIPDSSFNYLMEQALSRKQKENGEGMGNWHDCYDGKDNCMESEVTPPAEFIDNDGSAYFDSFLNCDICVYGGWVTERLHNHRPEIHPGEVFWFKEENSWKILLFQDESRRFDKEDRFKVIDRSKETKENIVPWVLDTLTAEVKIFFTFEENETVKGFQFETLEAPKHISGGIKDDWKGKTHLVQLYNEESAIRVEHRGDTPLVNIIRIKACDENGVKKGYIQFDTQTFKQGENQGYLLLEVKEIDL